MKKKVAQPSSTEFDRLYNSDYFSGKSSGYPEEGYRVSHPDWSAWLDFISSISPPGFTIVDLGCAYGYLPAGARKLGHTAFGIDVSGYALHQEREFSGFLAQGDIRSLPMAAESVDVVTVFDVLEHLPDPDQGLREAVRILKPGGLLVGATPDPIFFSRREETHFHERPPSYWVALLRQLGLKVKFRFSVEPYNFQFCAAHISSEAARKIERFQYDHLDLADDILTLRDETDRLICVLRAGWSQLDDRKRKIDAQKASVYLLNLGESPLRLDIRFQVSHRSGFSTLRTRLGSLVLNDLSLTSEQLEHQVEISDVLLAEGGQHLFFDQFPGGPELWISQLELVAAQATRLELTQALPFDLHQRYAAVARIAGQLGPADVLDVGGYLGDQDGHLATTSDFLMPEGELIPLVTTTDLRQCDHPSHLPADACAQPFEDQSFEMVISLDVIEHLVPENRIAFLRELDRVAKSWILIGAPFHSEMVENEEIRLSDLVQLTFLNEHRQLGLPSRSDIDSYFQTERGYEVLAIPNGYLPRWSEFQLMTQIFFSLHDYQIIRIFNRLVNQACFEDDFREPSYRTIFVIAKEGFSSEMRERLKGFTSARTRSLDCRERMSRDPEFLTLCRRVLAQRDTWARTTMDLQFLINSREEHIELLLNHIRELERTIKKRDQSLWRQVLRAVKARLSGSSGREGL